MKKLLAAVLTSTFALGAGTAFAGGPVVVVEEAPVAQAETPRSGWIVPVVIGLIVVCAVACGDDPAEPAPAP